MNNSESELVAKLNTRLTRALDLLHAVDSYEIRLRMGTLWHNELDDLILSIEAEREIEDEENEG